MISMILSPSVKRMCLIKHINLFKVIFIVQKMIITVFGTGSPTEEGYKEAYELGRKIASAGHILKNGGYAGIMKASAKGCTENGGKAIGVCIKGHSIATEGKPNEFLSEVIIKENLTQRVEELLKADCIIVLPGKIGTLEELFKAWNEVYIAGGGEMYLVGEKNKRLLNFLVENDFVNNEEYLHHIKQVDGINDLDFLK